MSSKMKLIIKMSIPPAISMLIQSLYNLVDSIYITRYDELAMEAISLVYPIQNIILAIALGISIGVNAYVATKIGEGKLKEASSGATLSLFMGIVHYLILLVLGLVLAPIFIRSFTSNEVVIEYAKTYINLMIIFSFTQIIMISFEKVMQADKKMMPPMIALLAGSIVNIVLDPLFIFTFNLGILGAAIATVLGQLTGLGVMTYYVFSKQNRIKLDFKNFKFDKNCLKSIYLVGIPSIILTAIPSLMVGVMNYILVDINSQAITTFGIYYKLQFFVYMTISGVVQGTIPLIAQAYGAGDLADFKIVVKDAIILSVIISAFYMVLFLLIPGLLMKMFYKDMEGLGYVKNLLRVASLSFIFSGLNYIIASYFQACQSGFKSLIIALLRQFILMIPLAYLLSLVLGEMGCYLALPLAEGLTLIITLIMFRIDFKKREAQLRLKNKEN